MTPSPHSIRAEQSLTEAHRVMRAHRIRHLPVVSNGALVGVVSQTDLQLIESLSGVESDEVNVEEAMTRSVFAVSPDATLERVVSKMADTKCGSAIVMVGDAVVGVFTTVDALHALSALLEKQRNAADGVDAEP